MNWYLEDGHTLSQIAAWQERLTERGEAALTVLSDSMAALRVEDAAASTETLLQAWREDLRRLAAGGEKLMHALPRAEGFFVGAAQRHAAYVAICGFFSPAWEVFSEMEQVCVKINCLRETLLSRAAGEEALLQELIAAKYAAARMGDAFLTEAVAQLAEDFYTLRTRNSESRRRIDAAYARMFAFCDRLFPALAARIGEASDMEHEGVSADTGRISVLVAELDRLLRSEREAFA